MTMMKIRLILFVLLSVLACDTSAQTSICNSLDGYNTHDLAKAYQWTVNPGYGCLGNSAANCSFYFSFCQPAAMCFNEYSACESSSLSPNLTVIGSYSSTIFYENESGPKGFYAKFLAGPMQNVSNGSSCEPSLVIKFQCNLKAQWLGPIGNATATAPQPDDIAFDLNYTDRCRTIMTFDYAGACYKGKDEPSNGIGGGAIFIIILAVTAFVYFAGGMAYNGFVNHRSGINLLPQAQFWIGLPLSAIEGCRFIMGICTRPSTPSQASYESV